VGALRVALATPTYWPEVRRGAERFVHELAHGLLARGHEPVIVTTTPGRPGRRREEGVEVLRAWRAPVQPQRFEDHLSAVPALRLALHAARPDAVIATHATAALAAEPWPAVFAFMGIPHRASLVGRRARLRLVTRATRHAQAVTALSQHAARVFEEHLGVSAEVIAPAVDLETFSPGGTRAPVPTLVCAADAGEPRKRVGLLLEAFEIVRRVHPDAELILDRRSGPRAPGVHLADMDDRGALAGFYRRAWASVLPSWGEAFGLVLAEALACGTPVVGANREGIPEVLGDDPVGGLFDGEDAVALAAAILATLRLAQEPGTAAACRARAERFSRERCAEAYDDLMRRLPSAMNGFSIRK
jgi:glycosyltransferase involved in cell wall biosynthesis